MLFFCALLGDSSLPGLLNVLLQREYLSVGFLSCISGYMLGFVRVVAGDAVIREVMGVL